MVCKISPECPKNKQLHSFIEALTLINCKRTNIKKTPGQTRNHKSFESIVILNLIHFIKYSSGQINNINEKLKLYNSTFLGENNIFKAFSYFNVRHY